MSTDQTRGPERDEPVTRPLGGSAPDPALDPTAEMPLRPWRRRRTVVTSALSVFLLLSGLGLALGTYYYDSVPAPDELTLPESTTIYYADGTTVMAKLGTENRTLLTYEEMNEAVRDAIVAAEDRTFWTNPGIDVKGVARAAWNNITGGGTQGASTITQQYARVAAELKGVTYSRKLREAIIAWKLARSHEKYEILEYYLNTVPFGRGAYGIEAAAQAYFGKTANSKAPVDEQITLAEAMVLVAMVKQPEPNPDNPDGEPGYDPTRSALARQNSIGRWQYIRDGLVEMGELTPAQAQALVYPETVLEYDPSQRQSGLDRPTGLVVNHVFSELRQLPDFADNPLDYIINGGFRIVTTIDKRAQDAAEAAADIRRDTAPEALQDQPENWQAALVAVEPGTGRVLAYYGGGAYNGADHAGWFYDEDGNPAGFGYHPPGSTFKVYDLAEAVRRDISVDSVWDSPPTKEFPASGRTRDSQNGPVRNAGSAPCQPECTLVQATVASLNVPFFELTEQLGTPSIIEMAARAGIDSMWANDEGRPRPVRVDLRGVAGSEVAPRFSTEVGIGQYGITVQDHANGMATFAAGGKRAQAHFVRTVESDGELKYEEDLTQTDVGLTENQVKILTDTLHRVPTAGFSADWDAAGKTGTWQAGDSITENAHVWMVGYTRALAAAVWVGTTDGKALITSDDRTNVFGSTYAGPIWQQFMADASEAMQFDEGLRRFERPAVPTPTPQPTVEPTPEPTVEPTPTPTPEPTVEPTPSPTGSPGPKPTGTPPISPRPTTITVEPPPDRA